MRFDISGKNIIVTGASSGIGRQIALSAAQLGAGIALVGRREEALKAVISEMQGDNHCYIVADLCDDSIIESVIDRAVSGIGKLDGLVYSAGIAPTLPYKVSSPKQNKEIMQINFFSYFEMVRQFAKKKYSNDGAKIVGISSCASIKPSKGQAAYAASKAAMVSANLSLAQELMPRKININCIRPGFVSTPMTQKYEEENSEYNITGQPLGFINTSDISDMAMYLLSDCSNMITGRAFDIDGGSLL